MSPQTRADGIGACEGFTLATTASIISGNNTRQGYAPRGTLKLAGYFFPGLA